jgi:hypothetical protein
MHTTKTPEKTFRAGAIHGIRARAAVAAYTASRAAVLALIIVPVHPAATVRAATDATPRDIDYDTQPPAPPRQTEAAMQRKSGGCVSCHTETDEKTMHANPGVNLGCVDCHGGDARVMRPQGSERSSAGFEEAMRAAHVPPLYPEAWNGDDSATPERTYTLLNKEAPEYIRFINPGDYRVAEQSCGACHGSIVDAAKRSLMATNAMFWGGAAYNNGILPYKRYLLGEAYTRDGEPARIHNPVEPTPAMERAGIIDRLYPMPAWETVPPADVFRVFERGGRNKVNLFPETGLPNPTFSIQLLEEPGRPDIRQSNRGPGTGARIGVPVLNLHKTRLNGPNTWFMGTNDQPGDFRSSGCTACHVVYANDRDEKSAGPYAQYGHWGESVTADPMIPNDERGHPLRHEFTNAIPTSQCMICHMHQPNSFVNSFLGYTMWDYESDAPRMWPEEQKYPSHEEERRINERNPEGAAPRGKWGDVDFLARVADLNPEMEHTQFADYHGHGWNFRAVFKKDREGRLLDEDGDVVSHDDPDRFDKAVHMSSIHADKGMHCVDCHFGQDTHGSGHIYGEVAQAIEIECSDCHGTADRYPPLVTSGPAAKPGGRDLSAMRVPDGRKRFEWRNGDLYQRSQLDPDLEWKMSLVKDSVTESSESYNPKAARAKLVSDDEHEQDWGKRVAPENRAHRESEMMCTTCHTSWTTSCAGCHLPIEANWKTDRKHYEGGDARNYSTYNPQVVRDQMFQLGLHGPAKGNRIAPVRSSSALVLSSRDANRQLIYTQQPPVSSSGYSSQAFAPHFAHTVRKNETKTCDDCHLSEAGDNNAIMSQLLLQGTDFVDFVGYNAWVGQEDGLAAVRVTEWEEPQAVIGSYLHEHAFPDWFERHTENERQLDQAYDHGADGTVGCLQLRGEYVFVAEGAGGMRVYDAQAIGNKGFSQRLITQPFSPLGHDTHIDSTDASCVALPTTQPIHPDRNSGELMRETNMEQPFHPVYDYAAITDRREGLILTDVNTLADGEPRNNFLERAVTFNPDGALNGARHIVFGGHFAYITTPDALVIVDLDEPLEPSVAQRIPLTDPRASVVQFRYLFVTTANGLEVVDITHPEDARRVVDARVPLTDPGNLVVARTYAYVADGTGGLAIVDVTRPEQPELHRRFTAGGRISDARDVIVGASYASVFAYIADGRNGLQVVQLTSPRRTPGFYGFSPAPEPRWIAGYPMERPATALSRPLERDRAVDETGHQIAVFGRIGSRPFDQQEMRELYLDDDGEPWFVSDTPER